MQAKRIITTTLTAATALGAITAAAAFTQSCSWWVIGAQGSLTGYCAANDNNNLNRHSANIVSHLDLNHCIGVDGTANAMIWQPEGNAFKTLCSRCAMQSSEVVMQCACTSAATGGRTSSSVHLDDRVYVDEQGHLTC